MHAGLKLLDPVIAPMAWLGGRKRLVMTTRWTYFRLVPSQTQGFCKESVV